MTTSLETLKVLLIVCAASLLFYGALTVGASVPTALFLVMLLCLAGLLVALAANLLWRILRVALRYWPVTIAALVLLIAAAQLGHAAERVVCRPSGMAGIEHCSVRDSRGYEVSRISCHTTKNGVRTCRKIW